MAVCLPPPKQQTELPGSSGNASPLTGFPNSKSAPPFNSFTAASQAARMEASETYFQPAWPSRRCSVIIGGACIEANFTSTDPTLSGSSPFSFVGSSSAETVPPSAQLEVPPSSISPPLTLAPSSGPFATPTWPPENLPSPPTCKTLPAILQAAAPEAASPPQPACGGGPKRSERTVSGTFLRTPRALGRLGSIPLPSSGETPPVKVPLKSRSAGNLLKSFSKPLTSLKLLSSRPDSIPESAKSDFISVQGVKSIAVTEGPSRVLSWSMAVPTPRAGESRPQSGSRDVGGARELGPGEASPTLPELAFGCHWVETLAGQDRVHVVAAEERDFLFAAVYDGFNDVAAAEFLTVHLCNHLVGKLISLNVLASEGETPDLILTDNQCEVVEAAMREALDEAEGAYVKFVLAHGGMSDSSCSSGDSAVSCGQASTATGASEEAKPEDHHDADAALGQWKISGCPPEYEKTELPVAGAAVVVAVVTGGKLFVMNLGDSAAILVKEPGPSDGGNLTAEVLSNEHNTNNEEELHRVRAEREDDPEAIHKDRVKGKLKLTRAFGAPYLKYRSINDSVLGFMRVKYVGTKPYISSTPHQRHVSIDASHKYLVLASDGLFRFQPTSNIPSVVQSSYSKCDTKGGTGTRGAEVVAKIARGLVDEALNQAAERKGMRVTDMVAVPAGEERRELHDDLSVVVVGLQP